MKLIPADIYNLITITAVLTLSFVHFILYFQRSKIDPNKNSYLNFALLSFFISIYILTSSTNLWRSLVSDKTIFELIDPPVMQFSVLLFTIFLIEFLVALINIPEKKRKFLYPAYAFFLLSTLLMFSYLWVGYDTFCREYSFYVFLLFITGVVYFISFFIVNLVLGFINNSFTAVERHQIFILFFGIIIMSLDLIADRFIRKIFGIYPFAGAFLSIGFFIFCISYSLAYKFKHEYILLQKLTNNLEKEVEKVTREVKQQKKKSQEMYVNFAHETKSPLTIIQNCLETLKKNPQSKDSIEKIGLLIKKLIDDVINFLEVAKIENNHKSYNHNTVVDLSNFVKMQIVLRKETAKQKNVVMKSHIDKELYIKSDLTAIDRILFNLVENALKYTDEGSVLVDLRSDRKNIKLVIRDTGIGIKEECLSHIFESSYRGELAIKSCKSGYGMGLRMVKHAVDSLEGNIEVTSEVGYGTVFTVTFPSYEPTPDEKIFTSPIKTKRKTFFPKKEIADNEEMSNLPHVMIVDDNKDMRDFLKEELSERFTVITAENGKVALGKLSANPPVEVIVSDRMMPVMDGDDFFKETRNDFSHIPFLFLTSINELKEKTKAIKKGVIDYLPKPFNLLELEGKLNAHVSVGCERKQMKTRCLDDIGFEKIQRGVFQFAEKYNLQNRQVEILSHMLTGKNPKEIASELSITASTVRSQKQYILERLQIAPDMKKNIGRHEIAKLFKIIE